ncbi:hypothetical protein E2C01_047233 [Portunus trituberculatus]|uniref:Uncharacterized protein n=1 Tax=Portunus trituberculatus TaxID=210409 RepID=A0A5B7G9X2_PORTR|nr:hypothetical protein [Portunus trituberculatus]
MSGWLLVVGVGKMASHPAKVLPSRMEYSWLEASCLEDDLALFESGDPPIVNHWPELPVTSSPLPPPTGKQPSVSSSKRHIEGFFYSSADDCLLPAVKTARSAATGGHGPVPGASVPLSGATAAASYRTSSSLPAFAPRDFYVKLSFDGSPSTDTKLRWLSAVNKAFQLQRDPAEVKMAAITSRFFYISRQRTERVKSGEFLSLSLIPHDSTERPRKFPSYILTRFPVDVDPGLAGIYSARHFIQGCSPISRIVVV